MREQGGEDWWYAHTNVYDLNGVHIGYGVAGYNTVPGWGYQDATGCFGTNYAAYSSLYEFETTAHSKGGLRCWVAYYDLTGLLVWCKSLMPGVLYDIEQDPDGSLVVVGELSTNRQVENWSKYCNLGLQRTTRNRDRSFRSHESQDIHC